MCQVGERIAGQVDFPWLFILLAVLFRLFSCIVATGIGESMWLQYFAFSICLPPFFGDLLCGCAVLVHYVCFASSGVMSSLLA